MHLQQKQRSFLSFGFSAGNSSSPTSTTNPSLNQNDSNNHLAQSPLPKRESTTPSFNNQINNIASTPVNNLNQIQSGNNQNGNTTNSDAPEIRKYKKRFNSEILCAALWGVNLLIGTENGLMLLDRSGQGKVYQLISRRRFQQMEVLEGQNILVTISGKKSRIRVYYLSWLFSKIIRTEEVNLLRNIFIDNLFKLMFNTFAFLNNLADRKAQWLDGRW